MLRLMSARTYVKRHNACGLILAIGCIVLSTNGLAELDLVLVPTRLEEFVNRYDTEIVFEQEIAHFNHEDDYAWISAIVVETTEGDPEVKRGLLVQLMGDLGADQVYLDAEDTLRTLTEIKRLYTAENEFRESDGSIESGMHVRGTGTSWCFRARPVVHMLCPEIFRKNESTGILLRTMSVDPTHVVVSFPDRKLLELEAALIKGWLYLFRKRD